jgi:ribosomal protein S27AE
VAPTLCGRCGAIIERNEPILEITLPNVKRKSRRCGACAESPVPPDLPEAITNRSTKAMKPILGRATWKINR